MKNGIWAAIVITLSLGCGASLDAETQAASIAPVREDAASIAAALAAPAALGAGGEVASATPMLDIATLPSAPWSEQPVPATDAPRPLLVAWAAADNREQCAPLAARSLGRGDGARARAGDLDGGWALEFDRRGAPGIARDGSVCERCGRATFGIAGTAMTPEELAELEHGSEAPTPSFRDGSYAEVGAEEDGVAAATITIAGQGCVYQVWSFLGREHVEELVRELRRVDVDLTPAPALAGL